jgi:carbon-monoxide dehydrogenase medium subunit
MYAPAFDYHRPTSVAEAQQLLAANPGAKLLAGGHSLLPMLKLRLAAPSALIDIGRIAALQGITAAADGGGVRIGAMTTHAAVVASPILAQRCPVVAEAAAHIGDLAVRNRGTIGGSVAHADPAADMPTVLTAVGATMEIAGTGGKTRTVDAAEFFQGMMATAVGEGEILTAIHVPAVNAGTGAAYAKLPHPASRYAVVSAAAVLSVTGGVCARAIIIVGGATATPVRLPSVEQALTGAPLGPDALAAAAAKTPHDLTADLMGDLFASAEYRRHIAGTYVARALTSAAARTR